MPSLSVETFVRADHVLRMVLPTEFPVGAVRVTLESITSKVDQEFQPKTDLGRHLWEIRQRAIANGMKLLSQDEVLLEVRNRRGEQ